MKIGKLNFKPYAAQKPLTLSMGKFLSAQDVAKQPPVRLGSLLALSTSDKLKLTLERYRLEPDFKLGIIGVGILTKKEVVEHIKKQTDFGRVALNAEIGYCNELMSTLTARRPVPWPKVESKASVRGVPAYKWVKKCIWLRLRTRALFCENTTDDVTTPFANYRMRNVHPVFARRGFSVVALTGTDNERVNFVPRAKNRLTVYLSGVGHGSYTVYTGHWGNHILEVGKYDPAEVATKSIHFLSCQTGRTLGPDTVAHGAHAYAGYNENFVLQWDDGSTPQVNEFRLFARSDSTFDIAMAYGATAQKAYDATIQAFNAAINQVPNTIAATYLTWDRDHLRLSGNPAAVIRPYRYVRICFPIRALEQEDMLVEAGPLAD